MKKTITESKARKYFESNARCIRNNVYGIRIGFSPKAFYSSDTDTLWDKFWEFAEQNPDKIK